MRANSSTRWTSSSTSSVSSRAPVRRSCHWIASRRSRCSDLRRTLNRTASALPCATGSALAEWSSLLIEVGSVCPRAQRAPTPCSRNSTSANGVCCRQSAVGSWRPTVTAVPTAWSWRQAEWGRAHARKRISSLQTHRGLRPPSCGALALASSQE